MRGEGDSWELECGLGARGVGGSAAPQSREQPASPCSPRRGPGVTSDLGSPGFPPGNYRTQLYDKQREEYQPATPGLGMFVEVKDPEDKVSGPFAPRSPPLCTSAPDAAGADTSLLVLTSAALVKSSWLPPLNLVLTAA